MNLADTRLTLPPPERCRKCLKIDTWTAQDVERHRCGWGHIMVADCPHFLPAPLGKLVPDIDSGVPSNS